jgi:hypothetical protein
MTRKRPPYDLVRDLSSVLVAFFILIYLTIAGADVPYGRELIAAAVAFITAPVILRLREKEKNGG